MNIKNYFFFLLFLSPILLISQNTQTIKMNNGEILELASDQLFFADDAPSPKYNKRYTHFQRRPKNMLGAPKILTGGWPNTKVTSLGCRGSVVVMFKEKGLVDGTGPDLLIFEEGQYMEATSIEISTNGKDWIYIGIVKGGKSTIDIALAETKGKVFHYVRFKDQGTRCDGVPNDGADINAVAALHVESGVPLNSPIQIQSPTPIERPSPIINTDFILYPNPTSNELNLKFELKQEGRVNVRVFDQQGKLMKTITHNETKIAGDHIIQYSLGDLVAGTYYVQLMIDGKSTVKKLIKQ